MLIFRAGLYQLFHPPAVKVVLYDLHGSIWWAAILLIVGLLYCIRYNPNRA